MRDVLMSMFVSTLFEEILYCFTEMYDKSVYDKSGIGDTLYCIARIYILYNV